MKQFITLLVLLVSAVVNGQTFKFYYSNHPKFMKGADTMAYPFTGGVDIPQFSSTDLNRDGKRDIFVFDRNTSRVLCFLNTPGGYQHAPQYEYKFPYMKHWALMRDFNLDGAEDLWTASFDDRRYAFDTITDITMNKHTMRIWVQAQDVFGFKQIGPMVTDTGRSRFGFSGYIDSNFYVPHPVPIIVMNYDIPSLEDMDGDGDIDILAFYDTDLSPSYYENYKRNPYNISYGKDSTRFIFRDKCWGGIFYDVNAGYNHFELHREQDSIANCTFRLYGKSQQKHSGTSSLMLDLNQDGIKDLLYGDAGWTNMLALYNGKNLHPLQHDSIITEEHDFPINSIPFNHIVWPASYYVDADQDGLSDLLVTTNAKSGTKNTDNVWVYKNTGTEQSPVFSYQGNDFFMFENTIDLGSLTVPVVMDIDADGNKDLLIATSGDFEVTRNVSDHLYYYRNIGSNQNPIFSLINHDFLGLSMDSLLEMHPAFGDVTGDGKLDLVIGMSNGKLRYYKNESSGGAFAFSFQTEELGGIDVGNSSAPQLVDLNKDGLLDLVIGNKNGIISYFKNKGSSTNPSFSAVADIDTLGGIITRDFFLTTLGYENTDEAGYATPHVCELDGDTTTMEMVTGMWNGRIFIYTNVSDTFGKIFQKNDSLFALTAQTESYSLRFGQRSVPFAANLDGDDRLDLLIGNLGGGLNFYASIPSPVDTSLRDTIRDGLPEWSITKIKVYPNPTQNKLSFDTYSIKEDVQYEVVNLVGQVMLKGDVNRFYASYTINTQSLPEGVYFLKLRGSTQSFVSRFLISR